MSDLNLLAEKIISLSRRIEQLEQEQKLTIQFKSTTGNPTGRKGLIVVNENDDTTRIYANGSWKDFTVITKTTTGDPSITGSGLICVNEFDNNVKIYADGAWRTIISW